MDDSKILDVPKNHQAIQQKSEDIGFSMPSDIYVGTLLKTLACSKPSGSFLELGTGIGLSLSWMIEGMDKDSNIISIDNDPKLSRIAETYFGNDTRVRILCMDAGSWIDQLEEETFDLVFADAWPGKYSHIARILDAINPGGYYIIDDMTEQPNWPEGHQDKASALIDYLEQRTDFSLTKMNWSTGIIIAVKKN